MREGCDESASASLSSPGLLLLFFLSHEKSLILVGVDWNSFASVGSRVHEQNLTSTLPSQDPLFLLPFVILPLNTVFAAVAPKIRLTLGLLEGVHSFLLP